MKTPWTPWHEVVQLRDDVRSGELPLAAFAADLYDVAMGTARPIYQDPGQFFALTYPTFNLRELAREVVARLAGRSDKAIRQLELTYGGGKTHALITLFHLVRDPAALPSLPAVDEFRQHIGLPLPQARIAVLPFDKLDVEKGMEIRGPVGETRWLRNPWSVLAFQLAGSEGLRLLHPEDKDAERDSPPAESLLVKLLEMPAKQGLATLILIDEVLMYVRQKVGVDPAWRARLIDFFQYLTQAVTKVDGCALVASLLATDPRKSDNLGKELTQELYAIFRREREEGVQPVLKEDVAEVLRRRFFTAESIRDRQAFAPHVVAALKGIADLDEQTRKDGKLAEDRYLQSYPFHPDLTDVFYSKWTNLEGFQRTRGILRTFALALRGAERWDRSPLVGPNVFLAEPGKEGISEAARELTTVAGTEEYQGKRQEWTAILESELAKAREIQREVPGMAFREVEQAVVATFLHSQPIGQRALTRDLLVLLGPTRPDPINLEKALKRWADTSWFLDESVMYDAGDQAGLPRGWRLGSKPNLKQMHHEASLRVSPDLVQAMLLDEIGRLKSLTAGATAAGVRVHTLPTRPANIDDDDEFHYAVLGPQAASDPGKPSAEACRFLKETGPERPRSRNPNAVVLAVPSRDGLEVARMAIRDYLAWKDVGDLVAKQEADATSRALLASYLDAARKRIPDAIRQAYCLAVTLSDKGMPQAFKLSVGDEPLFSVIKADGRLRIQETPVSPDALLPGGPYDLWEEGETARWVKDLVGAFAQSPRLPKMLNRDAILGTLIAGCLGGLLVLRLTRPDRSIRTYWREAPDESALKDPGLEAVLPAHAVLTELPPASVGPGVLPGVWDAGPVKLKDLHAYFAGGNRVQMQRDGYLESVDIPRADPDVVNAAVRQAVKERKLWLTAGPASLLGEDVPPGLLTPEAELKPPPAAIDPTVLVPAGLPEAWEGETTNVLAISVALSHRAGKTLPWITIREAVDAALKVRVLEVAEGTWPCERTGAAAVSLRLPVAEQGGGPGPRQVLVARAELSANAVQDLADKIADITRAAAGYHLKLELKVEMASTTPREVVTEINRLLAEVSDGLKLG